MTLRQQRAAWVAVLVLGVLLPFAPAVLGLRTLSHRDTDQLYAPVRTLVVEALRDGRLPLWNPYEGTGKPLFAEGIHSVLHPLSLLGAAVAPSSIDFLILAYLVAAALGAFLLARTLEASEPASAGAGLAFALSGYSVSMTGNLVFLAGLSTLPWLLAAARSSGGGSRWGIVLTALATASAFFSGDVQTALVGLVLGTFLAADAGGLRGAARTLAGMFAGVLIAGVQIVASLELLPLTVRGLDLEPWEKTRWSLAPGRLLEWFVPGLFRGPLSVAPTGASGRPIDLEFSESIYLGVPLTLAAALGASALLASARRRTGLLLVGAAALLLWLAFGHRLGARQALDWLPVWNQFRYSEKLMPSLALLLTVLAALGIDASRSERLPQGGLRALAVCAFASGSLLLILVALPAATTEFALRRLGDSGPHLRATLAVGLPHFILALVALFAVDRVGGRFRASAFAFLVALPPAVAASYGAHFGAPEARRFAPRLQLASDSPTPRLLHPAHGFLTLVESLDFVDGSARQSGRVLHPATNVAQRVDTFDTYGGFAPIRLANLSASLGQSSVRVPRRYAATHVLLPRPVQEADRSAAALAIEGAELLTRSEDDRIELWAVPHRPWVFFARDAVSREGPAEAHGQLMDLIARGDEGTVVVEAPNPPPTAPGLVLSVERATERVRVEAESVGQGLLVVQDAFWPGWRASIDGQVAEILAADYLVRAIRWPAGRHTLKMVYDPPEIRTGLTLSALGVVLVSIFAAWALRTGHRLERGNDSDPFPVR